jgi:hypothetical protein
LPKKEIGRLNIHGKGKTRKYSDAIIIICHQINYLYKLPYRQTQGLLENIKKNSNLNIDEVPNYTTMCRRIKTLELNVKDYVTDRAVPMVVAVDSTGISIYNLSDWHRKMTLADRKYKGLKRYRKFHVMMDLQTRQVVDIKVTEAEGKGVGDPTCAIDMVNRNKMDTIIADGAYCTRSLYRTAYDNNVKTVIIPPKLKFDYYGFGLEAFKAYNESIRYIKTCKDKKEGMKLWKQSKGYYRRSRIESYFASFKRTFGRHFVAKCDIKKQIDMIIKVNTLNILRKDFALLSSKISWG